MANKASNCIWYESGAEEAAAFYASVFPDSSVGAVHRAPGVDARRHVLQVAERE